MTYPDCLKYSGLLGHRFTIVKNNETCGEATDIKAARHMAKLDNGNIWEQLPSVKGQLRRWRPIK